MITIIIPTYNGSKTVELAVLSAIRQTIQNKEIIVVDDNGIGTDEQIKTQSALEKHIDSHEIIYIPHEKNLNGSAARNTGLEHAKGEYITFVDDDDYIFPDKLEKQAKKLKETKDCSMCICSGNYVNLQGKGYKKRIVSIRNLLYRYLMDRAYFNTTAIVFSTAALREIHGFDTSFVRHQDWEVVVRFLSKYKACVIKDIEMTRYIEGRNNPQSYEAETNNLNHFFSKTESYMKKAMNERQVQKVKKHKQRLICQGMIHNKDIHEALAYSNTYGNKTEMILAGFLFIPLGIRKVLFGMRKITESKKELRNRLLLS